MEKSPGANPSLNRALWLIAFSLTLIATCFFIMVVRDLFPPETPPAVKQPVADLRQVNPSPWRPKPSLEKYLFPVTAKRAQHVLDTTSPPTELAAEQTTAFPPRQFSSSPSRIDPEIVSDGGYAGSTGVLLTNSSTMIVGRVVLRGTPPAEIVIRDAPCRDEKNRPLTTKHYDVSTNGGLANVLVYIKDGLGNLRFGPPTNLLKITFANCAIDPYISAALVNQRIVFQNANVTVENVHLISAKNRNEFNVSLQSEGTSRPVNFSHPEIFLRVRNDLHPWEFAYISIMTNPFFAVTDRDGNFTITNVPPGEYVIEAVHRKTHSNGEGIQQNVSVSEGNITRTDFTIELPADARQLSLREKK